MNEQPVSFTREELWLLQSVIRHELAQPWVGSWPPANLDLNDQIASALVLCEDHQQAEATLLLSRGDLYAIDYCVPQGAKSPAGALLGKPILLKTFRARLGGGPAAEHAEEPAQLQRLEEWQHAAADDSTGNDPDHQSDAVA